MFRDFNETIEGAARAGGLHDAVVFMCECGDDFCAEDVELTIAEYEPIRAVPTHFLVRPGHFTPDVEVIIEQRSGYWVVEKTGGAADVARDTDPRT
jgi:hypothetical protein